MCIYIYTYVYVHIYIYMICVFNDTHIIIIIVTTYISTYYYGLIIGAGSARQRHRPRVHLPGHGAGRRGRAALPRRLPRQGR